MQKIICTRNDLINCHKLYCKITDLLDEKSEYTIIDDTCHHYLVECTDNYFLIRFPGSTVGKIFLKDKQVIEKIEIYKYFYEKFDENKTEYRNKLIEINKLLNDKFAGKILIIAKTLEITIDNGNIELEILEQELSNDNIIYSPNINKFLKIQKLEDTRNNPCDLCYIAKLLNILDCKCIKNYKEIKELKNTNFWLEESKNE